MAISTVTPILCVNPHESLCELPWLVQVGWVAGRVRRDEFRDWCERNANGDWIYNKGGHWWFGELEDAVAFQLMASG
jgi:hypothetical protein